MRPQGFICKLGLPCCTYGLKIPNAKDLISANQECLCARSVAQFPFGDKSTSSRLLRMPSVCSFRSLLLSSPLGKSFTVFPPPPSLADLYPPSVVPRACPRAVSKPVCAVCCFQCAPQVGCMKPGPGGGAAPEGAEMER